MTPKKPRGRPRKHPVEAVEPASDVLVALGGFSPAEFLVAVARREIEDDDRRLKIRTDAAKALPRAPCRR